MFEEVSAEYLCRAKPKGYLTLWRCIPLKTILPFVN